MLAYAVSRIAMAAAVLALVLHPGGEVSKARPAAVAGAFYPADAAELQKSVDAMLAAAPAVPVQGQLRALVAPHAGYPYSGPVAAYSYAQLKGRKYSRVVVIAPSHYESFDFASIYDGDAYTTPLGRIPVDKEFAAKLAAVSPLLKLSTRGHVPSGDQGEHAVEVQLPFLQRALGEFKLVPVVMGDQSYEICRALGVALAKLITSPDTLIVASSDLSHYHSYEEAVALDRKPLKAVQDWDYYSLAHNLAARAWEACGGGPIVAAMIAAEHLGATQAAVLKYANSGDATGDRSRVVGYGAAALVQPPGPRATDFPEYTLSERDRTELLRIARKSAETAVRERSALQAPAPASDALLDERGAFVTVTKRGELRGCIGYTSALRPLYLTVRDVAAYAALRDPRFPSVTPGELGELSYEISVLSPFRRVTDVRQIQVGRHGLLIKKGNQEGVLLPQVPVEQGWDRKTFLQQVGLKAGLPRDAWQDPDVDLFLFTALVFGEHPVTPPAQGPGSQPR